jgi:hypothetical protein
MPSTTDFPDVERQLVEDACAAFQRTTIRFKAKPALSAARQARAAHGAEDGAVQFDINGRKFRMAVLVKTRVAAPGVLIAQHQMHAREPNGLTRPLMLVTQYVWLELAEQLIARNVPFLDTAGNAYLSEPELIVMITGRPKPAHSIATPSARSTTPKGLQTMYALATRPGLVAMPYRTIADAADVSLNTIKETLDDLLARGLVAERRSGVRLLPDPKRFIIEWANLYPSRLRPKLRGRRFASTAPDWWRSFDFGAFEARLGGEAGADVLTNHLKASSATIYTRKAISNEFILRARLRPDERGDVEILEAFWPPSPIQTWEQHSPPHVHPLLIYADLIATGDDRNISIAEQIYDDHLAQLHG